MCSVDGCGKPRMARGWCTAHYALWRKHGTPERRRRVQTCEIDGCERPRKGGGLCGLHYARRARHGSPLVEPKRVGRIVECARAGCTETVRWFPSDAQKYCSSDCYRASEPAPYTYQVRICLHCGASYSPTGPMQKHCPACVGPTVYTENGSSRSEGGIRLRKYGVTHTQWLQMLARFDGKCWICRSRPAIALDHSHASGKPRGALCLHCNSQLGAIERDGWLASALAYLEETSGVCVK